MKLARWFLYLSPSKIKCAGKWGPADAPDLKRKGLKVTQPTLLARCGTGIILRSIINIHVGAHMRGLALLAAATIISLFSIGLAASKDHGSTGVDPDPGSCGAGLCRARLVAWHVLPI